MFLKKGNKRGVQGQREFLIKRTDSEWFSLHQDRFNEVLRPHSIHSQPTEGWGDHRITISNGEISFSFEESGFHVVFKNYSGTREEALGIIPACAYQQ